MPAFDMRVNWPNGARIAVMLTFDFDAETLWMARDPENARRPGILSQGAYGAKVGVPMILEVLRQEGVKATFFVVQEGLQVYISRRSASSSLSSSSEW